MTLNKIGLLAGVNVIALGLAFTAVNRGTVELPDLSSLLPGEVSAAVPASQRSTPLPQPDSMGATLGADVTQVVTLGERNDRTDTSRECAPDQGITSECIYN